ncbi:hypothetical protein C8F01DRAFT_1376456 [Mycena amicta]|nr:hypothetical protein C8F01DRAFT_1376456 [Mycena amicta]
MSSDDERLPRELEQEIFRATALLYPSTIPTLLRVARRVLIWVEPLLYRTLNIRAISNSQLNAASAKPPTFLARAVRSVVLDGDYDMDYNAVGTTLSLCTGVTRMAISGGPTAQTLLPVLSAMPIRRIAGSLFEILGLTADSQPKEIAAHPLLRCLTHIDLFEQLHDPQVRSLISAISFLPFLTHLGINHCSGLLNTVCEWIERILKTCQSLRIVAILDYDPPGGLSAHEAEIPESLRDPRLVLCSTGSWFEGVLDAPNFWTVAEDFVARKRRGEVDANIFWAD